MATQTIHKSRRHANPMQTKNGRPKLKAFDLKALYALLEKTEKGKKRHKVEREIVRKTRLA